MMSKPSGWRIFIDGYEELCTSLEELANKDSTKEELDEFGDLLMSRIRIMREPIK